MSIVWCSVSQQSIDKRRREQTPHAPSWGMETTPCPSRRLPVELRFAPPTRPWSTNEDRTLHWAPRAKRVKAWRQAAFLTASAAGLRGYDRCLVEVELPFERHARRDPMNYVGTCVKAICDGIVDAGVVPDDTVEWMTVVQPTLVVSRGGDVVVRLSSL